MGVILQNKFNLHRLISPIKGLKWLQNCLKLSEVLFLTSNQNESGTMFRTGNGEKLFLKLLFSLEDRSAIFMRQYHLKILMLIDWMFYDGNEENYKQRQNQPALLFRRAAAQPPQAAR